MDTETTGLDWTVDRLELCQLYAPSVGVTLVQRADREPTNLMKLVADSDVLKVFHHAPFDLRFLESTWGVQPSAVLCTKAAAKLLAPSAPAEEYSLKALLNVRLGVQLDKGLIRVSNWGSPRLSPEQVRYASADVMYLLDLADQQRLELERRQLWDLYQRICQFMPVESHLRVAGIPNPFDY